MTEEQMKAAASLRRSLRKIRDADLRLLVYDGGVFVCPADIDIQGGRGDNNAFAILLEHGMEVGPVGLDADGGAGV